MFGDHGYTLGERNLWEKKGLDELDTHIPLLISAPWLRNASSGLRTTALAEAVDIMPTVIDLSGLPPCDGACLLPGTTNSTPAALQGVTLMPALLNPPLKGAGSPEDGFKQYAFSQFPRCNCTYDTDTLNSRNGTCQQHYKNVFTDESGATGAANMHVCLFNMRSEFDWMGYSVRSDAYRYTAYVRWDTASLQPRWHDVVAEELYNHTGSDSVDFDGAVSEAANLLGLGPSVPAGVEEAASHLRQVLVAHFSTDY